MADISRAYFYAEIDPEGPHYVPLPPENPPQHRKWTFAILLRHLHGTRNAADGWQCECEGLMSDELGHAVE